jgi:hypothetical protein
MAKIIISAQIEKPSIKMKEMAKFGSLINSIEVLIEEKKIEMIAKLAKLASQVSK